MLRGARARRQPFNLQMGRGNEQSDDRFPGPLSYVFSEAAARGLWSAPGLEERACTEDDVAVFENRFPSFAAAPEEAIDSPGDGAGDRPAAGAATRRSG